MNLKKVIVIGLIVLITLLIILVGLEIIFKVDKDPTIEQNQTEEENIETILKKENLDKEYVYVLENRQEQAIDKITSENYLKIDYRVPYLNLTGNIAKGINSEIANIKNSLEEIEEYEGMFKKINYTYYKEGDIISLGMQVSSGTRNSGDFSTQYLGWNIDIKNNRLLSLEDMCENFKFDIGDINKEDIIAYNLTEIGDLQVAILMYNEDFGESYIQTEIIKER